MSSLADRDPVADAAAMGRSAQVVASALVAARFLPIWLAMAALLVVAALFAPSTLENTSWSYILPYMTILAIAALGQMLVVMQAGIDLSTAGVISLCGNVLVGVSVGSEPRSRGRDPRLPSASGRSWGSSTESSSGS